MSAEQMSQSEWMLQAQLDYERELASEQLIQLGGKILRERPDCEYTLAQLRSLVEILNIESMNGRADVEYVLETLTCKFAVAWDS